MIPQALTKYALIGLLMLATPADALAQSDARMGPTADAVRPLFKCANEHARYLATATPDDELDNVVVATRLACSEVRDANLQAVMDIWSEDFSQRLVDTSTARPRT